MEERSCSLLLRVLYPELSTAKQLTSMLDILTKSKDDQAENDINEAKQEFLYETARSEYRRVKILEAMLVNDMDRVCHLLTEAVEIAYKKRKGQIG